MYGQAGFEMNTRGLDWPDEAGSNESEVAELGLIRLTQNESEGVRGRAAQR